METEKLHKALVEADAVVVGAGAGLSTSAGFTYSGERFEKHFADFIEKYGFTDMYTAGFHQFPTEEEHWAYWSRHIYYNRYVPAPKPVYDNLLKLVQSPDDLELIFNEQLERCGVDYFDYYWLHCMNHDYVKIMDRNDGWGFIARKKAEGKIRHIGFSFHDDSKLLEQILKDHPDMEFVQLQINYIDWDSPSIESGRCYDLCTQYGKPVIVMEPVKGGSLAKVPAEAEKLFRDYAPSASPASWAVRYCASLPNVMMVLSGMSNLEQLEDNTAYMQDFQSLNEEEQAIVKQAADIIKNAIAVPCTACHYCTDGCPMQICIPEYFSIYNTLHQFGREQQWINCSAYYAALKQSHGKASDCVECGQCESHCPQHIQIIETLKKVAATFE